MTAGPWRESASNVEYPAALDHGGACFCCSRGKDLPPQLVSPGHCTRAGEFSQKIMRTRKRMAKKPRGKRGRPTRKAASTIALAGLDLAAVDPTSVLRSIAADDSAPASARVAAAKALLSEDRRAEQPEQHDLFGGDAISRRALTILQGGRND